MDVKTAFLYPTIEQEVYIAIPEGYWMFHPDDKSKAQVFQLLKTLYSLRQSPLAWFKVIDRYLQSKGLTRSNKDASLYISKDLIIMIFVDDILLFSSSKEKILEAKQWLLNEYKMMDLEDLKQFLGMQIFRDRKRKTTVVGQERHFQKVLQGSRMQDCKGTSTPMETKVSLV